MNSLRKVKQTRYHLLIIRNGVPAKTSWQSKPESAHRRSVHTWLRCPQYWSTSSTSSTYVGVRGLAEMVHCGFTAPVYLLVLYIRVSKGSSMARLPSAARTEPCIAVRPATQACWLTCRPSSSYTWSGMSKYLFRSTGDLRSTISEILFQGTTSWASFSKRIKKNRTVQLLKTAAESLCGGWKFDHICLLGHHVIAVIIIRTVRRTKRTLQSDVLK